MSIISTSLSEVKVLEYPRKNDVRGYSYAIYDKKDLEKSGIDFQYNEERVYYSAKAGTLYGIHFQNVPMAQAKLLYCLRFYAICGSINLTL